MSTTQSGPANSDSATHAHGENPVSQIHVEERKLTLHDFLGTCMRINGSDLHLQAESIPMIRVDGQPRFLNCPPINEQTIREFVDQIMSVQRDPEARRKALDTRGAVDLAYIVPGVARFRTNIFRSRETYAIVMRRIVTKIPNFEELSLPAQVEELSEHQRGIIIVSGTTGSGKSTTLAAIIGKINRTRAERIITVEDPIEYHHENVRSLVSQVEVGTDSESYDYALREMMRQDPDIILIGEIRDTYSLTTALQAADTGHLVFSTVHAANAAMTVERLVSLFDPVQKDLQQMQLASNLIAVFCQRLAKRREGKGRIPVIEMLQNSPLTRRYILDGEFDKIKGLVGNREGGSQSFDQHLTELFQKQQIDVLEAKRLASNVDALNLALRGIGNSDNRLRQQQ
jgi:twitching motility protein PilT